MLYLAFATDYDGTLAHDGAPDAAALDSLTRLKATGKRLLLVTGREIPSLKEAFPGLDLFDIVVAENGAVLYFPQTREERPIAPKPSAQFVEALQAKGVQPLSAGHCIVATWTPNETHVLETIRELGMDWQVIFNKGAVMCLPPGVNKASGLAAALAELKLLPVNAVGAGDAENDLAFLTQCGYSVAVANAIASVKEAADVTTGADHGRGVAEFLDRWIADPAAAFKHVRRHEVYLGEDSTSQDGVALNFDDGAVLIAGSSGAGKSRLTTLLIERLVESAYQVAIVDPEGDYGKLEQFTHLGDTKRAASAEEARDALNSPHVNVVMNLLGIDVAQRPDYFNALLGLISGLFLNTGRPHWVILDEAHHLLPRTDDRSAFPVDFPNAIFVTTHPNNLSRASLAVVHTVIAVGKEANEVIAGFCELSGVVPPAAVAAPDDNQVLLWARGATPRLVAIGKSKQQHQRHTRKYAEGRLGEDISFYFRGPEGNLNLRAYNLAAFLELAKGVDDPTWMFHLARGDYTRWFKDIIKDDGLADEAKAIEPLTDASASRQAMSEAIKKRYTITATDC